MVKSIYYNGDDILTYNCLFNFIVGNRGAGKTYWFKDRAIRNFLKDGSEFFYVRRYSTEIKKAKTTFWTDIAEKYPDHKFSQQGDKFLIDGVVAGYSGTLSTAKILKSVSYPKVTLIGFDEFIIEKSAYKYLPNEVEAFLDLYETISRTRDVVVFFLSNAVTFTNPYFLYFNIKYPRNKKGIFRKNEILLQLYVNKDFVDLKKQSRFGQIISGTNYSDYSIDNKFLLDSETFLERKTGASRFLFAFVYKGNKFGIWVDYSAGKFYVSADVDPSAPVCYSLTMADHSPNLMIVKGMNKHYLFKQFIDAYQNGYCYFESMNIKNISYEVIKMVMNIN